MDMADDGASRSDAAARAGARGPGGGGHRTARHGAVVPPMWPVRVLVALRRSPARTPTSTSCA